ncbi:O-antigen ligase family protein [Candidatus Woesearchaeota archaeon]|nr:O-antigen ligase family protein [Candidatus Woesearchaeota archaeon]
MRKIENLEIFLYLIILTILTTIIRVTAGDYKTFTGSPLSHSLFLLIISTLFIFFFFKKYDYFILVWSSVYFAAPIIKVPGTEVGSLGILNLIFLPLMIWKIFDLKDKRFYLIPAIILLSLINLADVPARLIISGIFNSSALPVFLLFVVKKCKNPELLIKGSIFIAIINLPLTFYEYTSLPDWGVMIDWRGIRVQGNLFHPNGYTLFLLPVILLTYAKLRERLQISTTVIFIVFLVADLLTRSRIGLITLVATIGLFEIIHEDRKHNRIKKILIAFAIAATIIIFLQIREEQSRISPEAMEDRTKIWEPIIPYIKSNLLIGNGVGSYEEHMESEFHGLGPHNLYLGILFEFGIIGLTLILLFVWSVLKEFFKMKNSVWRTTGMALIIGILIYSITESNAFNQVFALNTWILLGALLLIKKMKRK